MRFAKLTRHGKLSSAMLGLVGGFGLAVAGGLLHPSWGTAAEDDGAKTEYYSTDPAFREECRLRLGRIHEAILKYQKEHKALPRWLSDLVPEYVNDPNVLVCPYVHKSGIAKKYRDKFVVFPVFADPKFCTYAYEFCLQPISGLPAVTCRSYKQSQMVLVGFGAPIVRCLAHRPVLNLAFDGSLYESDVFWEDNFVRVPEDEVVLHDILLTVGRADTQPVPRMIQPREAQASARFLDLSKQYNATMLHLGQLDLAGNLLQTFPEGLTNIGGVKFDVRGLIHLTGRNFPIPFPERVDGILVEQKCAQIHFLHGAMFSAAPGTRIASYVVHYQDGRTNEVPVVYGRDVRTQWHELGRKEEGEAPKPAWISPPKLEGPRRRALRLYRMDWKNLRPEVEIKEIRFVSHLTDVAPFLVAVTLE